MFDSFWKKENVLDEDFFVWTAHWPLVISFAYLFGVYFTQKVKILPPVPQSVVLIYNVIITILSGVLVYGMAKATIEDTKKHGQVFYLLCEARDMKLMGQKDNIRFWMVMYWFTKIIELTDTFLKIANGSRVIFLHVFHHGVMVIATWQLIYYDYSMNWMAGFLNSLVHVIMYGYYVHGCWNRMNGLAKPKWGVYVTYIQLIQFWMGFTYFIVMMINVFFITGYEKCYNTGYSIFLVLALNIFFITQFTSFFYMRWRGKKKKKKKEKDEKNT